MHTHLKIAKCLTKWMTDMDLWLVMQEKFKSPGSLITLSRERRKFCESGGAMEREKVNKQGVKYKQFKFRSKRK